MWGPVVVGGWRCFGESDPGFREGANHGPNPEGLLVLELVLGYGDASLRECVDDMQSVEGMGTTLLAVLLPYAGWTYLQRRRARA